MFFLSQSFRISIFVFYNATSSNKLNVIFDSKDKSSILYDWRKFKIGFRCRTIRVKDTQQNKRPDKCKI